MFFTSGCVSECYGISSFRAWNCCISWNSGGSKLNLGKCADEDEE